MEIIGCWKKSTTGTTVVVVTQSGDCKQDGKRVITLDRGVVAEDEIKGGIAYEA